MNPQSKESNDDAVVLKVDNEDHTFGNMLRDVMWNHPHITIAQYAQEDPNSSNSQLIVQCQSTNAVPAEQSLVESLHMMKEMFLAVQKTLDSAVQEFEKK